jgi:predicted ester cyclase
MMTEANKRVVRRFYDEVMGRGRADILDEVMVEDFVDHGEALFGSPRGRETLRQGIVALHDILPDLNVFLEEVIAEGDLVGVRGVMRCTHVGTFLGVPGTGHQLTWPGNAMFRVIDGKIAERWFNSDGISILRQLGLAPAAAVGAL